MKWKKNTVQCIARECMIKKNVYVLIECRRWQAAMQQHQLPSQILDSCVQQAFSFRFEQTNSKKTRCWKMKCNAEQKNSHNFFTVSLIFCSWFRLHCVHEFLMLTAPLALFEFRLRSVHFIEQRDLSFSLDNNYYNKWFRVPVCSIAKWVDMPTESIAHCLLNGSVSISYSLFVLPGIV